MKKNILVIEDSKDQIAWAKKQLGDGIIVAENIDAAIKALGQQEFDYILSDLELPMSEGEKPELENGRSLLENILLPLLGSGLIKGLALVSNYEHHVEHDNVAGKAAWNLRKMGRYEFHIDLYNAGFEVSVKDENAKNFFALIDLHVYSYDMYKHGETFLGQKEFMEITKKDWGFVKQSVLLKPWKRVLEVLMKV